MSIIWLKNIKEKEGKEKKNLAILLILLSNGRINNDIHYDVIT